MKVLRDFRGYLLACSLIFVLQPVHRTNLQQTATLRDGQHDFEIGNWKTHESAATPGLKNSSKIQLDTGYNDAIGFAPAIEYSWNSKVGILLGARVIPIGRNTAATITPAIAINIVR